MDCSQRLLYNTLAKPSSSSLPSTQIPLAFPGSAVFLCPIQTSYFPSPQPKSYPYPLGQALHGQRLHQHGSGHPHLAQRLGRCGTGNMACVWSQHQEGVSEQCRERMVGQQGVSRRRKVGHAHFGSFMRRLSSCSFCEVTVNLSSRSCCWYRK